MPTLPMTTETITFNVTNDGPDDEHEFVVFRSDLDPGALPTAEDGTVDKYIGDAIVALFGAPLADSEHAAHAVAAASSRCRRRGCATPDATREPGRMDTAHAPPDDVGRGGQMTASPAEEPTPTAPTGGSAGDGGTGGTAPARPVTGRWFEDLTPGLVIDHAIRRTVTEADNTFFSVMTMNPQPLHLDETFAQDSEFGARLVNSLFTLSLLVGISVADTTLGTTVGNLGFEEVSFPAPVFHGDTIRGQTEVVGARASSSRPGQGIVTFEHRAYNQRDQLVARARRAALMLRRP